MKTYDVIILGAGASGLMCAKTATQRGKSVLILDHSLQIGQKIKISGGGRCNFTNLGATWENYLSQNPKFCISALSQYTPHDFLALVQKHEVPYVEKAKGQLFCQNTSKDLIKILELETQKAALQLNADIQKVEKEKDFFKVETDQGIFQGAALVVATGGMSFPKLGATSIGYQIAKQFGHKNIEPYPALDPFILSEKDLFKGLSGIAMRASISCGKKTFTDDLLLTHKGLSGPVVLQISSYWGKGQEITIDFLPNIDLYEVLKTHKKQSSKKKVSQILSDVFSRQFTHYIVQKFGLEKPIVETKDADLKKIADQVHGWKIIPLKTQGYDTAEVTRGGVSTAEISSQTMESKKVSGLFFVGEVLDVTGDLGGYNLQWAWSSGHVAGLNI
ncbi:MAG: NAD(P)/FAD-dependent oxidoreductase [Alphaproteobacteria bacterium]|nr:NAD(P)/FAD-dependent oxidoreductase [Alphaproteobacteria bacterium]MBN2779722.1 NAD(P)/FAD-dependent oxidoreductase [Alphaproteobacteria bacterium]